MKRESTHVVTCPDLDTSLRVAHALRRRYLLLPVTFVSGLDDVAVLMEYLDDTPHDAKMFAEAKAYAEGYCASIYKPVTPPGEHVEPVTWRPGVVLFDAYAVQLQLNGNTRAHDKLTDEEAARFRGAVQGLLDYLNRVYPRDTQSRA